MAAERLVDYFAPQLYWRVAAPGQPFEPLLAWWAQEDIRQRHLWPGLFTSRSDSVESTDRWRSTEIVEQIRLTRAQSGASGHIHFSMRALMQNRDSIADRLRRAHASAALVPAAYDTAAIAPTPPEVEITRNPATGAVIASLTSADSTLWLWTVRARHRRAWRTEIIPGTERTHELTRGRSARGPSEVVITAVDRLSREGIPVRILMPRR